MAVLRGVTITGHDPAYTADAINLSRALERLVELFHIGDDLRFTSRTSRILGRSDVGDGRLGELLRSQRGYIGIDAGHRLACPAHPHSPVYRRERAHGACCNESRTSPRWLFPSVIIRRKDRLRYYDALAESDLGGNLELIAELIVGRAKDALRDHERTATAQHSTAQQGYDIIQAKLHKAQERQAAIWNDAVSLLFSLLEEALEAAAGAIGHVSTRWYDAELSIDDYAALSQADSTAHSWLFRIDVDVPGLFGRRFLAWTGFRSCEIKNSYALFQIPPVIECGSKTISSHPV